ncbi:MAG: hypothetical protein LUH05_08015 [Candidatus Gastranaerophilales bacterium]|nr:hypothetical protein [Candidatus Gastranaerophilales bacterium]
MKIYKYEKEENKGTAKLFGFPILEQTSDYMTSERYQNFFGGLVTTHKINDISTDCSKKDIKILGKSIIKRTEENLYRNYFVFGKKFRSVSLINEFKKEYFKYFDKKYDDIYILRANSGETFLTLTYIINTLIKRNKSKTPLFAVTQKYHIDMIKMICPDIPYVYIGDLKIKILEDEFKIDNFRFFLLYSNAHFKKVEYDIKSGQIGKCHYFKSLLNRVNINENEIEFNKTLLFEETETSMLEKVNKTGLNLDNFIFLVHEAKSCKLYDKDFWIILIRQLQDKGYDIFINQSLGLVKFSEVQNYKSCDLTFGEAFALAKRAKKIISLRSGITEFLLQTGTPIDVLYTKFRRRHFFDDMDVYHVLSGFNLSKLPCSNKSKIQEFNTFEISQKEIIEKIIKGVK